MHPKVHVPALSGAMRAKEAPPESHEYEQGNAVRQKHHDRHPEQDRMMEAPGIVDEKYEPTIIDGFEQNERQERADYGGQEDRAAVVIREGLPGDDQWWNDNDSLHGDELPIGQVSEEGSRGDGFIAAAAHHGHEPHEAVGAGNEGVSDHLVLAVQQERGADPGDGQSEDGPRQRGEYGVGVGGRGGKQTKGDTAQAT